MVTLIVWRCSHCFNTYLNRPEQCVNAGVVNRWGVRIGCGSDFNELQLENITSAEDHWDTFDGFHVIVQHNGKETMLNFLGDNPMDQIRELFDVLKPLGVLIKD